MFALLLHVDFFIGNILNIFLLKEVWPCDTYYNLEYWERKGISLKVISYDSFLSRILYDL